ncbi:hypothetical protein D3C78_1176460 [compost metagenome]
MLTGLWHRTIGGRANQDRAVHLGSTGDHVLHVVSVTWAVNVSVVTNVRVVLDVSGVDGDTARFFFRSRVDLVELNDCRAENFGANASQSCGQSGLTVVNVADGADVNVGKGTIKFFFSHDSEPLA